MSSVSSKIGFPAIQSFWEDFLNDHWFNRFGKEELPAINVQEKPENYLIEAALPGYKKEDVMVSVENNVLTISSNKSSEKEDKSENFTRKEWSATKFKRSFSLPLNADEENLKANYSDGVLQIVIPKKKVEESASAKKIVIH